MICICLLMTLNFIVLLATSELDCDILQQDLNNVMDWGRKWLTNFNLHKCKSLSFGIQVKIKKMNHHLERVEEERDLARCFI